MASHSATASEARADAAAPLRHLRAAEAVARLGSAAAAAAELHLSVSAVSRAVQQAERQLGQPLFERGARGMAATPAAEVLLLRVRRALAQLQQAGGPVLAARATDALLHALVAVAATRSEGAAGQRLGVSQAAVNGALRQLEHAARARLFQRSRRGTRVTEAGERALLHAKLALAELRTGHDEFAARLGTAAGRLAVGALPMAADVLVPQALARLFRQQPGLQVLVADGTYEALVHQLRHGDLDLVVGPLRGSSAPGDIAEERLFVDRLVPVVRAGHPLLARGGKPRSLRTLQAWPWIGPLPDTPARTAFERGFGHAALPVPPVALQVNSPAVVRSMLRAGDQVALLSPLQIRAEVASGLLVVLPVPLQGTERSIGVMLRRDGLASPALKALLAALRGVARAAVPRS